MHVNSCSGYPDSDDCNTKPCLGLIEIYYERFSQVDAICAVAITDLLTSYREQLEKASVGIHSPEYCTKISVAFPNAKMEIA